MPAGSPMARFIGVDAYEAAGGPVLRDLFGRRARETASGWRTRRCSSSSP